MAMNPMQRKANNYLLMGILGTLLVTGMVIVFLFMQLNTLQQDKKKTEAAMKKVWVTTEDIKSGEAVTYDKLKQVAVTTAVIPANTLSMDLEGDIAEDGSTANAIISKIAINKGTIVTNDMLRPGDEVTTDDLRKQEYNMIILPSQIQNGDYVDIRLRLSDGVDYIVASKKQVTIPEINGVASASTITVNMNEAETIIMANAIIEAYYDLGSLLYVTTYVEPGMQGTVIPTYVPSGAVQHAIISNPNIVQEAKNELVSRYNQNTTNRNLIENSLAQYAQDKVDNIQAGVQEQITKAKEERQLYLESLGGY